MTTETGPIIRILPVPDFAQMDEQEATKVLYDRLVSECLRQKVRLCDTPNAEGVFYITLLNEQAVLSIEKVQKLFATSVAPSAVLRDKKHKTESDQMIAAMLLRGYEAHFSPDQSKCTFVEKEEETLGGFGFPCLPF
jgi:hypothetical protein